MKLCKINAETQGTLNEFHPDIKELYIEPFYGKEGLFVQVLLNGKLLKRKVYHRSNCGLYIIVKNIMFFPNDLSDEFIER